MPAVNNIYCIPILGSQAAKGSEKRGVLTTKKDQKLNFKFFEISSLSRYQVLVPAFLVIIGIGLRLRAYLSGRSLWLDEAALAVFFIDRSLGGSISLPLPNSQSAPPGFLFATQFILEIFGANLFSFRLLSLVASLISVILFAHLSQVIFRSFVVRLFSIASFSLSPVLIYYSAEFKQYSLDVLAVILIMIFLTMGDRARGPWIHMSFGIISIFSLPGIMAAVFHELVRAYRRYEEHQIFSFSFVKSSFTRLSVIGIGTLAHLGHAFFVAGGIGSQGYMTRWWREAGALAPESLETWSDLFWALRVVANQFAEIFIPQINSNPSADFRTFWFWAIPVSVAAYGLISITKKKLWPNNPIVVFSSLISLGALVLASAQLYPFGGRASLYLIPVFIIFIAEGIDYAVLNFTNLGKLLSVVGVFSLLLPSLAYDARLAISPYDDRDAAYILDSIQKTTGKEVPVLVNNRNINQMRLHDYLGHGEGLNFEFIGDSIEDEVQNGVVSESSYWVVSTRPLGPAKEITGKLNSIGYYQICTYEKEWTYMTLMSKNVYSNSSCPFPEQR